MEDLNVGDPAFVVAEQEYEKVVAVTPDKHYYLEGLPCPYVREELATPVEVEVFGLELPYKEYKADQEALINRIGELAQGVSLEMDIATLLEVGESTIWSADSERKRRWYAAANRMRDFFGLTDL